MKRIIFTAGIAAAIFSINSCAPKYTLTVDSSAGGSVTVDPSGYEYTEDELVTVNAQPDDGYYFAGWNGDTGYVVDSSGTREIQIQMPDDDISLSADFAESGDGWTVMVYMAGDNSLSPVMPYDINEMEEGLYNALTAGNAGIQEELKILVLADAKGSNNTTLYLISPDNSSSSIASSVLYADFIVDNEVNMADPDILQAFIEYGLDNYASTKNALVMWNHGNGARSIDSGSEISKQIAEDETSGGDIMYMDEVQQAISSALGSSMLDIIGIDACLMGTVEIAYEFRNLADYYAASPASEWGYGWDYSELFGSGLFNTAGDIPSAQELAVEIVTQFQASTSSSTYQNTMTAVDLSYVDELKTAIDALAAALYNAGEQSNIETYRDEALYYYAKDSTTEPVSIPYTDIYDFCLVLQSYYTSGDVYTAADNVLTALDNAVIACFGEYSGTSFETITSFYETDDSAAVRGLSIFFSHGEEIYNSYSHYAYQWWYTALDTQTEMGSTYLYGNIDFADSDSDGTVETWRELFEAWYDSGETYTPGTY